MLRMRRLQAAKFTPFVLYQRAQQCRHKCWKVTALSTMHNTPDLMSARSGAKASEVV